MKTSETFSSGLYMDMSIRSVFNNISKDIEKKSNELREQGAKNIQFSYSITPGDGTYRTYVGFFILLYEKPVENQ
ncbi:MAG TPA: hypothetical protein VJ912_02215 [Candidatus Nanoarchaeia archaeon]|nr:hypothetical protein [Candidatus Nanoarchaeia archaeon]